MNKALKLVLLPGMDGTGDLFAGLLACDVLEELRGVAVPILYIRAKRDRLVGMASLDEIRQIRPETDVVVVDGPHLLFQREPQWTGEIVVEFVSALG